jgi:SAM-dependent methyltransferase
MKGRRKISDNDVNSTSDIYSKQPISFHGSIPVFSTRNEYIENYEKIARDHLRGASDTCSNPWIEEESWKILENSTQELIVKWAPPGARILDVGVGLGRLLDMLPEYERYGMDIAIPYLEISREKGIEVCMAMVEDMPYKDSFFDIIICTDVLEHVLDFHLSVQKILTVLKPSGILIIRVPYKERLDPYLSDEYPYYYVHIRSFDEHSLILQFTRCFKCKVLEFNKTLYLANENRFKYHLPTKFNSRIQSKFLKLTKKILPKRYPSMLKVLVEPTCINMVMQKIND